MMGEARMMRMAGREGLGVGWEVRLRWGGCVWDG